MPAEPQPLKDPVCGMSVTEQSEHRYQHKGHLYYFCSAHCKIKFSTNLGHFLEPKSPPQQDVPAAAGLIYTCPMHPEVRQDHPGSCPKCGMALEPELPSLDEDDSPELRDFQRRFWWTLPLTCIVFVLAMFGHRLQWMDMATQSWVEMVLTMPIALWAGWPFFSRGWQSL
ncbi:MAG: heavy metal-binding domain-containing protein, partial [Cellvibrio sp.]|uniref:heavy metal-binding domain-containing protein n=1 Tax=Cellvibrio sp. TaxID=1965322 RepID=UPI00271B8EB0|nr:heavy metal-binding domain-containing protein [Cellvibrio sp.]